CRGGGEKIQKMGAAVGPLLAERFKITQQVGELKAAHGLPPADPVREAQQIERLRALAEDARLAPEFAEKFLNFVIAEGVRHHEAAMSRSNSADPWGALCPSQLGRRAALVPAGQRLLASAWPAVRPENKQPPRKVPSRARYPWTPPPPKPAASPTAYTPGSAEPPTRRTRPSRSVSSPPRVLRVSTCSRIATSGPPDPARPVPGAFGSSSSGGVTTRISRSPRNRRAAAVATTCGSFPSPLRTCRSRASITCRSVWPSMRCSPTS